MQEPRCSTAAKTSALEPPPSNGGHEPASVPGEATLNGFMRRFYAVISFPDGGSPDWSTLSGMFAPHARITRVTPEGIDYLDVQGFKNMASELLEVGAYTSFYERELARRVDHFGKVVHVASAYETRVSPEATDYLERGINSLQLVAEGGQWRIISLAWDDHASPQTGGLVAVEPAEGSRG